MRHSTISSPLSAWRGPSVHGCFGRSSGTLKRLAKVWYSDQPTGCWVRKQLLRSPNVKKVKVTLPDGKVVEGVDVPIEVSNDRWSDITLEDGSVIRIKALVVSVIRIDGQYDQDGNPLYVVKSSTTTAIASAPEELRRK